MSPLFDDLKEGLSAFYLCISPWSGWRVYGGAGVKCDWRKHLLYHDALYRDSGAEGDGERLFRRWSMSWFM